MGEVYRATDTKLGREVALKVLPAETAASAERLARFQREARAVAALNHPHIVTIHSVEEADGVHFLTMELVEGEPLDRLIPEGGLPVVRIREVATALASALEAAHRKGIVHRDLKPANVMVTRDGRVKVLDFGLAKVTAEAAGDDSQVETAMQTREGIVMGTVPYMSPEQVQGRPVDQRTDVFSLGVILYEMATGRRPFHSDSTAGLMSAILRDHPPAPASLRAGLPPGLESVIARCLAKDPAARYQGAGEVQAELEGRPAADSRIGTEVSDSAGPGPGRRSDSSPRAGVPWIAVLPLKVQGPDPDLAAFADGLGEDITTGLSRFPHLFVISRHSTMQYAGRPLDVRAVGRELGARYALEGAVRKAGSAVRVSVQLLDAATGTHLWAETYDRDLDAADVFALQDDITDRVVATVADPYGVLVRSMALAVRDGPLEELSDKELLLRFCAYWHEIRPEEHARLRAALERKLEREPAHAEAWASLSRLYSNEHEFRLNPLPESVARALKAARRAVDIDPAGQAGWEALAEASYFARDLGAFRNAAERAMALNPRNTSTVALMGLLISHSGEWERGVEIVRRSMALNPHHPGWYHFPQFFDHYRKGEFDQALQTAKRLNMPEDFWVHAVTAAVCGRLGRKQEARAALEALRRLLPGYRDELGPTLGLWILDAAVVGQVMEGLAEAEALVGERPRAAPASSARPASGSGRASGTASARHALVVLPFVNMSDDRGNEFFSDGVTEEILTMLSKVGGLHVISRTSAMAYKGTTKSVREIARELGVDSVLEGSVRRAGNRVRVTAKLIEAASDRPLWSERYDRDLEDIFEVQSEVAVAIAGALRSELASDVAAQIRQRPTEDIRAYDLYLQGRQGVRTLRAPEILRGIRQLEEAIALDPGFAQAHAELALAHLRSAFWGASRGREDFEDARTASARALELAPASAAALVGRAGARGLGDFDWEGAEADLRQAIRLDPNEVEAHHWFGIVMFLTGRFAEAASAQERAVALDPHAPNISSHHGLALCFSGRQEEGQRILRDGVDQHPVFFDFPNMLGIVLKRQDRFDESATWYERACELSGRHPLFEAWRASALRLAGAEAEADAILRTLREHEDDPRVDSVARAVIAAAERDFDAALGHLHEAADRRLPLIFWCLRAVWCEGEFPKNHAGVEALWQRIWPGDTPRASTARRGPTPLVGREKERAALDRMLDEAASGRGGLVLLGGEPGVGKTRLATAILENGRERGMLALTGHASEDASAPFVVTSEILEEVIRLQPAEAVRRMLGDDASEIARLLPELRRRFPDIPPLEELPPEQQQRVLFRAVLEFLRRVSTSSPIVMLLDDVHWADESSLLLLQHLAPRLAGMPILTVGTYRDAEEEMGEAFARTLAKLVRQRLVERLVIQCFDERAVGELLEARGGSAPPLELVRVIHQGTEGNAFFIEELFRHLADEGALFDAHGRWRGDLDAGSLDVPEGVRLVIKRRLQRLREGTRKVLTTAAAIGLRFDSRILEAAVGDPDDALEGVEEAEAAQLVAPAAGRREARYEFSHALVRQTLLDELSPARRQRLHLAIADAMESVFGEHAADQAAEIAHQLEEAGTRAAPERTRRFLTLAGARALAAGAADEAIVAFDRALEVDPDLAPEDRAHLLYQRGYACRTRADHAAAAGNWRDALPLLESSRQTERVADVCRQLAYYLLWAQQGEEAAAITQRGLVAVGETSARERSRLLAIHGLAHSVRVDFAEADRLHREAIALAERLDEPGLLGGEILLSRILQFEHSQRIDDLVTTGARAIELVRRHGTAWEQTSTIGATLLGLVWQGDFAAHREHVAAVQPIAEREGNVGALVHCLASSSIAALAADELSRAIEIAGEFLDLGDRYQMPWASIGHAYRGVARLWSGDLAGAASDFEQCLAKHLVVRCHLGLEPAAALYGFALLGDERAAELYDRDYPLPERGRDNGQGAWHWCLARVQAAVLLDRCADAASWRPHLEQLMAQGMKVTSALGLAAKFAGLAAAAGDDAAAAERRFEEAVRQADTLPYRTERVEARRWYAWALRRFNRPGDADRALALLREAREICGASELPKQRELVEAMLVDLRAARRRSFRRP
jgi:TolB-like protein/cytochrome c-type biogenesis protein CcmH/NrfG